MFQRAHSEQVVVAHACHGHRYQPLPVPLSVTGKKGEEGVSEDRLHWRIQGSTSSPTGVLRIKPKEKYVHISMKEIWCNLDSLLKNKCYVYL